MTPSALPDLDELRGAVEALGPAGRIVVLGYLVVAAVAVVDLTAARTERPHLGAPRARSLAITAAVAIAAGIPFGAALATVGAVLAGWAPTVLVDTWRDHPVPAALACFVVVDALAYAYHRLGHHSAIGWASHGVHHAGEVFDMALVARQPWLPVHALVVLPLAALAGFPVELVAGCWAVSLTYQALQHTHHSWGLGAAELVLMSGRAHRRHHTVDGGATNLGAVLSVWDRALGTWDPADVPAGTSYGWGTPEPRSALELQTIGWRRAARATGASPGIATAQPPSTAAPEHDQVPCIGSTRRRRDGTARRPSWRPGPCAQRARPAVRPGPSARNDPTHTPRAK